jgi:hypothetical protein
MAVYAARPERVAAGAAWRGGIGLAFRGGEAFLGVFLVIGLVFLTVVVFLRVDALAWVLLRFALVFPVAFFRFAITASLTLWIFRTCAESLLDKKVSQ